MSEREIIFVPMGDTRYPHPSGVCPQALNLRDQILRQRDQKEGRFHIGTCIPCFEHSIIDHFDHQGKFRAGHFLGGCFIEIESTGIKIQKLEPDETASF